MSKLRRFGRIGKLPVVTGPVAVALCLAFTGAPLAEPNTIDPGDLKVNQAMERATKSVLHLMGRYHYRRPPLDDELSGRILARYLDALDPTRSYFFSKDIDTFQRHHDVLDDALRETALKPAFDIFRVLRLRVQSRSEYAIGLLETEFDYGIDETILLDRSDEPWPANLDELNNIWRLRVKNDILNLRLDERPKEEIKDLLTRRYRRLATQINQMQPDDVFEMFMNAYAAEVEPHTNYFSRRTAENFRIHMSLSLSGIGAGLHSDQDYTVVNRIIPGGPADKSNGLHPEDKIVGVGQDDEPIENVIGWRLMDVVELIRGPKGTKVRLELIPADSPPGSAYTTLELVRDKIELEEQAAKLSYVDIPESTDEAAPDSQKFAVISLPSFYSDFEGRANREKDYRSSTRDVRKLLAEIKQQNVAGVIIDLRGNGGGALDEATELTGLFIRSGPIVQIKDHNGKVNTKNDPNSEVTYDGPLLVMVDRYSASASEIFAGAIQDYGRGLVIGETTFGKGTVQQLLSLNQLTRRDEELGQLKFTTAQFFRVNGHSTQHKGVVPDIEFDLGERDDDYGERSLENALPWSEIKPAVYQSHLFRLGLIERLRERHLDRSRLSPSFRYLRARNRLAKQAREIKQLTLNIGQRRQLRESQDDEGLALLNGYRTALGLEPVTEETRKDSELPGGDDHWNQVMWHEAARIQLDSLNFARPAPTLTQSETPQASDPNSVQLVQ